MSYLFFGLVIGIVLGYLLMTRRTRKTYLANAEYWVYLPVKEMPKQEAIMDRMLAANRFRIGGRSPIGPNEGLIFSDIRLHIALVQRSKNPHVFRPDLFDSNVEPTAGQLAALADSLSLVKLRYISEEPLNNKRHLQFLLHAAAAVADLGGGKVIFDTISERLIATEELDQMLSESLDATRPEIHTRVIWRWTDAGGRAESAGLRKIGVSEIRTDEMEHDQRVLISQVIQESVRAIWERGNFEEKVEVEAYGDVFRVEPRTPGKDAANVKVLRVQPT